MSPLQSLLADHRAGHNVGLYSVCCSHEQVLRAALQVAARRGTVLLIEATSNQVDQFGGYTGMTPPQYRDYVQALADAEGFPRGRLILGGDHLGPNAWQKQPAAEAMAHARVLIEAYVAAGFHKIHLDCSMSCADDPVPLPDAIVAARSAELAVIAEATAKSNGLPPPVYVIGTEVPVPGGEASLAAGLAVTTPAANAMRAWPKLSAIEPITTMSSQKCGLITENPAAAIIAARREDSALSSSCMPPPPATARRADCSAYQTRKATPPHSSTVVSHGSWSVSVRSPATLAKMKAASMAKQVAITGITCWRRMPCRRMKALCAPTTAKRPMPVPAPLSQAALVAWAVTTENMGELPVC